MGDILKGIYHVPRDERGRRIKGAPVVRIEPEIVQPISITVPLQADLDAEEPALLGVVTPFTDDDSMMDFDPAEYTVAQVLAYLADHPEDRERVVALEEQGKARKMIVHAAP